MSNGVLFSIVICSFSLQGSYIFLSFNRMLLSHHQIKRLEEHKLSPGAIIYINCIILMGIISSDMNGNKNMQSHFPVIGQ